MAKLQNKNFQELHEYDIIGDYKLHDEIASCWFLGHVNDKNFYSNFKQILKSNHGGH